MVLVRIPSLLADQAGGQGMFEVEASTVGEALRALPIADLLLDERGELRLLVNVYVDGEDARRGEGLETALDGAEEVRVIAAVAGGRPAASTQPAPPPAGRFGPGRNMSTLFSPYGQSHRR